MVIRSFNWPVARSNHLIINLLTLDEITETIIVLLYVDFIISTRARNSEWWEMKAEELQRAADRNDMKGFYSGLKEVWGPQAKQPVHLKSSDGLEIFTDTTHISDGKME